MGKAQNYSQLFVNKHKDGSVFAHFTDVDAERSAERCPEKIKEVALEYSTKKNKNSPIFVNTTIHGTYRVHETEEAALEASTRYAENVLASAAEPYYPVNR